MDATSISDVTGNIVSEALGQAAVGSSDIDLGSATANVVAGVPATVLNFASALLKSVGL